MLWYAIPMTNHRIWGLNVVIPGGVLKTSDAAVEAEARRRPGRISRALRPQQR
jgi:hypothetical protein